jgi:hypothetical protein
MDAVEGAYSSESFVITKEGASHCCVAIFYFFEDS